MSEQPQVPGAGPCEGAGDGRPPAPAWRRLAARALGRQRLCRFGMTRLMWRLCPPGRYDQAFEADLLGCRFHGNLSHLIDWWIYCTGTYEHANLRLLEELLDRFRTEGRAPCVLDVGANVGVHTALFARHAGLVVACEPFPAYADRLERLIGENALSNVTLLRCGLAERAGCLAFRQDRGPNQTGSFDLGGVGDAGPSLELPVAPGDALLAERGVERVDLIKIDTDGGEAAVLAGLAGTLARDRPAVLLEYGAATARKLPDLAALQAVLYPDVALFRVSASKWTWAPRLTETQAPTPACDLLAVPREAVADLPFRRG